jgi:hypothetical protein
MFVTVLDRRDLDASAERLGPREQRELDALGFGPRRRREWIDGRIAAHRALGGWLGAGAAGLALLTDPCGAPRVVGDDGRGLSVSLSHDGDWVAVAMADGGRRAAIDLCSREHTDRLGPILGRLSVEATGLDGCETWAALECVLKLRRRGISSLLDAELAVRGRGREVCVFGIGAPARVEVTSRPAFALAFAEANEDVEEPAG